MKKGLRILWTICLCLILAFVYYYITLPAINIHSGSFWMFIMFAIMILAAISIIKRVRRKNSVYELTNPKFIFMKAGVISFLLWLLIIVFAVYLIGSMLSSPIINASKYQKLLTVENRNFTDDISEADYHTIPLLDKDSASLLGNRKLGSLVDMVSQFEVGDDYTQINYKDVPVRVTPLVYANEIKWLTNQSKGIPAYIKIDMATQNIECVFVDGGIKYSKSELFNRNIYRHLRFNFPTYIFDSQIFFEIDDNGNPYWVCPVKKFNIGLFGGQTIGRVVLCNAVTGECIDYNVSDVPQWIDKVYSAELLTGLYDYYGIYKHGFFNSVLGQKDCLKTTNGYNYIALDDDVWVYTGITSVNSDQSNVGFVLMNQRTMETRYYKVEGAIEDSAMASAEGQVQNLGYQAAFPLLLNIADEPTYFMALKDAAGLVKKYAMVNVEKYQWVAIGDTIQECEKNYSALLNTNGIISKDQEKHITVSGIIESISPIVLDGNTHYYVCLAGKSDIYDIDMSNTELISIVHKKIGDSVTFEYEETFGLQPVRGIK